MNIVRASLSIRPAFQHLNGASQNPGVALEQRCLRTIPHAQVKQREELGLVLSDTERDYFREVCARLLLRVPLPAPKGEGLLLLLLILQYEIVCYIALIDGGPQCSWRTAVIQSKWQQYSFT